MAHYYTFYLTPGVHYSKTTKFSSSVPWHKYPGVAQGAAQRSWQHENLMPYPQAAANPASWVATVPSLCHSPHGLMHQPTLQLYPRSYPVPQKGEMQTLYTNFPKSAFSWAAQLRWFYCAEEWIDFAPSSLLFIHLRISSLEFCLGWTTQGLQNVGAK